MARREAGVLGSLAEIRYGEGGMAAYGLLQTHLLTSGTRDRPRMQLLRYCELDTLAMAMAWQGLLELP